MGVLFKDKPLRLSSPLPSKLYWGLFFGVLGNILMLFSIEINTGIIADLRHLAIVIAAAFGGFIPAIIASVIIAIGRVILFGFSHAAILPSIGALLIGLVCGAISPLRLSRTLKAFVMNLCALLILSIIFFIKIDDLHTLKTLLTIHYLISLIGGFIAYHFFVFVVDSNETQYKLKETEERFRLIAEYSSDMITMHNEKAEYIYISPAVKEVIHYEYPELLGKRIEDFIHPDDIEETKESFETALSDGGAESTYRYRSSFGDYIWIESTLKSVHFEEDGSKRVIIVSRNITDRKLTQQKLQEANELLNRLSYMDGLTGIANRRYFDETLEKEWTNCLSSNSPLTLMMFDIDYFKKYNDTYGHLTGDFCLQLIAQTIKDQITGNSDFTFYRYGGEEFALILPSTIISDGIKVAQHIQETIQSLHIPHSSSEIADNVTLSIGLGTIVPTSSTKPQALIQRADSALYLSKTKGRNTIST
ncbi:sensor domain-containing diguanylate cyclase [Neobacillus soli]|nr:diguanylate cyclase [Neobacillus soli]